MKCMEDKLFLNILSSFLIYLKRKSAKNLTLLNVIYTKAWISLVAQMVKNPSAMQMKEIRFDPLSWDDPLQKGMATHSNILAWRISWTEEPGGLQSMVSQTIGHDSATFTFRTKSHLLIDNRMLCPRTAALAERQRRSFQAVLSTTVSSCKSDLCFLRLPNLQFIAGIGPWLNK